MIAGWVSQYLGRRLSIVCVFSLRWFLLLSIFVCLIGGLVITFNHSLHSIMDLPYIIWWSFCWCFLYTIRCCIYLFLTITHVDIFIPGCCRFWFNWLKCHHQHFYVPWYSLSTWQCACCICLSLIFIKWYCPPSTQIETMDSNQLRMMITDKWRREEYAWLCDGKELINVTFWVLSALLSPTRDSQLLKEQNCIWARWSEEKETVSWWEYVLWVQWHPSVVGLLT